MLRRQCSSRIHHQLVLSLHQATSPCIPKNFSFKSANSLFAERWRTADRKCPLPIPLRRLFPAEWYLSPSSAHKSVFLLYHFFGVNICPFNYGIKVILFWNRSQTLDVFKSNLFNTIFSSCNLLESPLKSKP
jgi:hypothetical protein